jgi:hypothetical protein
MSIDIERELRLAMEDFTREVVAPPDLLVRVRPRRRLPRRGWAVAVAGLAATATIAAVVVVGEGAPSENATSAHALSTYHVPTDTARREATAARQLDDAVASWGPTRGDQAADSAIVDQVRAEWAHPTGHPPELGRFEPVVSPDRPVRLLWVGTTPEGTAALAVQHTKDPVAQWWFGVFTPDSKGNPRLAYRNQLIGGVDLGDYNPHVLSFTTSSKHSVIVVPTNADSSIRVAPTTKAGRDGRLVPQWQAAPTHDGAAVVSLAAPADAWGTVVEVSDHGEVVADHAVDVVVTKLNEGSPQPSNTLGLWCNGCVVGGAPSPGYGLAMLQAWVVRHGPDYLPSRTSEWTIGAQLQDGTPVLIMQMWLMGQQAHTVVLADHQSDRTVDVLADYVTDPTDRPLVALRLPEHSGWVIGAGPGAVVTGWRTLGAGWHDVASKRALLVPTDAGTLQLRLVITGHESVVTRTAD